MSHENSLAGPRVATIRKSSRGRVVLTTTDGETLSLHTEALELANLREGAQLDHDWRGHLEREDQRYAAHAAALRLLSHRRRSEKELSQRLRLRGIPADVIEEEIQRLRNAGLIDDQAFAQTWVEERMPGRSQRLLRYELVGRGVQTKLADEAVSAVDDRTAALALARRRAPRLTGLAFEQFSRRLAGFLQRRGFSYDLVAEAVRTVWDETKPATEDS
ncbi:MAG: RecX family transcriptional regulator [Dehalococcoidia bacterium]|nr:RecX family transcriptional regulator [Dehalococcoidia bacterium]|tara:strand:+ start:1330 stop:1983 length:654 start_codon:yes stop_codon:yes gene_type:complete